MKTKLIIILGLTLFFVVQSFAQIDKTANIAIDATVETGTLIPGHTFTSLMFPTDENRLIELDITHCREFPFTMGGGNYPDPGFHEIFPADGNPNANPSDLTNWDTQIFCDMIRELIEVGTLKGNLICGLWHPILNVDGQKAALPHDWNEYALWVKNIVRHLTKRLPLGNCPGHYWADNIYAWSFWNEPLGSAWDPEFLTVDEIRQIFAVWSKAIKEVNPAFLVFSPEWEAYGFDGIQNWDLYDSIFTQFYTYVRDNGGFVDFIDQHGYSWNPYTRKYVNGRLNSLIDNLGLRSSVFGKPKLSDTESFPYLYDCVACSTYSYVPYPHYDSSWASSWLISQACYGIGNGLQYWNLFTGTDNQSEYIHLYTDFGEKKPVWYAVKALTGLKEMKYVMHTIGSDKFGFGALCTKSAHGDSLIIFISNYDYKYAIDTMLSNLPTEVPLWLQEHLLNSNIAQYNFIRDSLNNGQEQILYDSYNLTVELPPVSGYSFRYERYIIDDTHGLDLADSGAISSNIFSLQNMAIPRFQSQVIKLYRQTAVGVEDQSDLEIPKRLNLLQNYPNPFNPETTIRYSTRASGVVQLDIYDALGRLVRRLIHEKQPAGEYFVAWDGRDEHGRLVVSGPFFYSLKIEGRPMTSKKMLLLK